jgi:hypothetical protein
MPLAGGTEVLSNCNRSDCAVIRNVGDWQMADLGADITGKPLVWHSGLQACSGHDVG